MFQAARFLSPGRRLALLTFMNTTFLRIPVFLALAASLASCVPMPHVAHLRPAVSGILVEDGKPIPGVELYLGKYPGKNQPCSEVGELIPVSLEGRFSWASVQERRLMDSLINPVDVRGMLAGLCIRHPDKGVLLGTILLIKQNEPVSMQLVCDMARPASGSSSVGPNTVSTMSGQAQYCVASIV